MKHSRFRVLLALWPVLLALLLVTFTAMADVYLPPSLTVIEAEAFLNDTHLTGPLVIPPSVRVIGPRAFEGCIGLTMTDGSNAGVFMGKALLEKGDEFFLLNTANGEVTALPAPQVYR